jgi:hypothetical protein
MSLSMCQAQSSSLDEVIEQAATEQLFNDFVSSVAEPTQSTSSPPATGVASMQPSIVPSTSSQPDPFFAWPTEGTTSSDSNDNPPPPQSYDNQPPPETYDNQPPPETYDSQPPQSYDSSQSYDSQPPQSYDSSQSYDSQPPPLGNTPVTTSIPEKIKKQMTKRGWTEETINGTINNPHTTREASNKANGNSAATAYYNADGSYVVRDDASSEVIQISDRNDPNWQPDPTIQNPYHP